MPPSETSDFSQFFCKDRGIRASQSATVRIDTNEAASAQTSTNQNKSRRAGAAWWLERRDFQSQVKELKGSILVRVEGATTAIDQNRLFVEIGLGTDEGHGDAIQVSRDTMEIGQRLCASFI